MKMKNPFENSKKWLKNTVMATVATVGMAAPAFGAEKPTKIDKGFETEISSEKTTPENNAEVVSMAASQERQAQIQKLEQKKALLASEIQNLSGRLESKKSDFSTRYAEVLAFLGKKKGALQGFAEMLANKTLKEGRAHAGGKGNIVSDGNIEGLKGVLLSGSGEFGKQITDLNNLMQGPVGSTTHQRLVDEQSGNSLDQTNAYDAKKLQHQLNSHSGVGFTAVGGFNEDLDQRGALGSIPGEIIEIGLFIADKEYKLSVVEKELEALYEIPAAPSEIANGN